MTCSQCGLGYPFHLERCPHCEEPTKVFPNVYQAEHAEETAALEQRYQDALAEAEQRGAASNLAEFEKACQDSEAVINRSKNEVMRLLSSSNQLYATWYGLVNVTQFPSGSKWDVLRQVADASIFPDYQERIRFASLTLDGKGLWNYGECAMVLEDKMIAHCATVFEENTVLFMSRKNLRMDQAHEVPKGYRASWQERHKLCVAKTGAAITKDTPTQKFPGLLLRQGETTADDVFVEVHVCGHLTAHTLKRLVVDNKSHRFSQGDLAVLRDRLADSGAELEVV